MSLVLMLLVNGLIYATVSLQLLLGAELIGVAALLLAAIHRAGVQPSVALAANHLLTVEPWPWRHPGHGHVYMALARHGLGSSRMVPSSVPQAGKKRL